MFIDKAKIFIKAGNGGNGAVTFHREKFVASGCKAREVSVVADVADAVARAKEMAAGLSDNPLIYIGGSTYVVSEAIAAIQCKAN